MKDEIKNMRVKAERDELLEAFERLLRVASVELTGKRPDVIEWADEVINRIKVTPK